jgi:hypothetical protein
LTAPCENGLYRLSFHQSHAEQPVHALLTTVSEQALWHDRLGHAGLTSLSRLKHSNAVSGIEAVKFKPGDQPCEPCRMGKATQLPFSKEIDPSLLAAHPLDRVHADLHGPVQTPSLGGSTYVLVIIDEFSSYIWLRLLRSKADAAPEIMKWALQVRNQFGKTPTEFHTDRGGEFLGGQLQRFWVHHGTRATTTLPYTPQHNGRAERANRTLVEMARTMLIRANAPKALWGEAILAAGWIINHSRVQLGQSLTATQRLGQSSRKLDLSRLKVWGCDAYARVTPQLATDKYDPVGVKYIFVGYDTQFGYRLMPPSNPNSVIATRHATFNETSFTAMAELKETLLGRARG